jgi:hypothetical protein
MPSGMMLACQANPAATLTVAHLAELIRTPWFALVLAPWLVLGTVALIRADRRDIPEIMRWLSRWGRK